MEGSVVNKSQESRRVLTPFAVTIQANNWFHLGWLDAVLGSEMQAFDSPDDLVRDEDCEAYSDGFEVGVETKYDLTDVIKKMRELKQFVVR
jgi:hypothetical protein